MSLTDQFKIISETNKKMQVKRMHILANMVQCPSTMHQQFNFALKPTFSIVGKRDDVYGLVCPICNLRAFAVRE